MKDFIIRDKYMSIVNDRGLYKDIERFADDLINLSESEYIEVSERYNDLMSLIISLISDEIYKDEVLEYLIDNANNHMDKIHLLLNKDYFILFSYEIINFIEEMLEDCSDSELYEACHNLMTFYSKFYRYEKT